MEDFILISAIITMKSTDNGGRLSGIMDGYRPNHIFDIDSMKTYIGDIKFDGIIYPGESKVVTVRFLKGQDIDQYMNFGQRWFINEGTKTIGFGEII